MVRQVHYGDSMGVGPELLPVSQNGNTALRLWSAYPQGA